MRNPVSHKIRRSLLAVLLAGTALGGYAAGHGGLADTTQPVNSPAGAVQPVAAPHLIPDFADLAAQVKPAVVSITVKLRADVGDDEAAPFMPGPSLGERGPGERGFGGHQRMHATEARGSGFIIDADGTLVTNNHVVKDATAVTVTLDDGTELPAKVIGRDAKTDLAVLRVSAGHSLPFISLGESEDLRPGQWVVAVGNPFGLGGSVTAGIVSARGRDIGSGPYDSFIQVDAPINQGNSGGPLFTQDGKAVGVNTAIYSPSGGSVGIGFAIPSDTVRQVVAEIEKTGHVTRGYLGVQAQAVSGAMTAAFHLPAHGGALVASVEPGSPAARAGLQPGDIIQAVDGKKITDPRALAVDVAAVRPGAQAALDVLRDGAAKQIRVDVTALPSGPQEAQAGESGQGIGLALAPLSADVRGQLDLPAHTQGALVASVKPGSPAEQVGLQAGDVVVGVGSTSVTTPEAAVQAIRSATSGGHTAALRILRDGRTGYVAVAAAAVQPSEG